MSEVERSRGRRLKCATRWKAWPRRRWRLRYSLDFAQNDRLIKASYEHTRTYRNHVGRQRIPVPWAGLELPRYSGLDRERHVFDAFSCAVDRLGAAGRNRNSDFIFVLEHRRKRDHVSLLYL